MLPENTDPREYFIANDVTIKQLAQIYDGVPGCSFTSLRNRSAKEGWVKLREEFRSRVVKRSLDVAVEGIAEGRAESIKTYYERILRLRNQVLDVFEAPRILDQYGNPMPHPMDPLFARGVKLSPIYKKTWDEGLLILREQGDGEMPTVKEFMALPDGITLDEI